MQDKHNDGHPRSHSHGRVVLTLLRVASIQTLKNKKHKAAELSPRQENFKLWLCAFAHFLGHFTFIYIDAFHPIPRTNSKMALTAEAARHPRDHLSS
jgi:hypothetical protein